MNLDGGVLVVGAGVAGLAAAGHLRAHGVPTTLVDSAARIGGRAWTTMLDGAPFDHGAAWFHDADQNPLVALATAEDALAVSEGVERLTIDGRSRDALRNRPRTTPPGTASTSIRPETPDISLAKALARWPADPWTPLLALWEGAIIAAVDAERLGLEDWHRNRLMGRNLVAPGGIGAFIARHLATEARLATPVTSIDWSGPGIRAETPSGTIAAAAAIVTVSTGVLAAEAIRFTPALPALVQAAIHALPMGLLTKVVFSEHDVPPGTRPVDRNGRMTFLAGRKHLIGFLGGDLAWSVANDPAAATGLAQTELRRTGLSHPGPATLVTGWGTDPHTRGAYAYAGPGDARQREVLAQAFPGGRVLFAGEATRTNGQAGTIAGAHQSGIEAVNRLLMIDDC